MMDLVAFTGQTIGVFPAVRPHLQARLPPFRTHADFRIRCDGLRPSPKGSTTTSKTANHNRLHARGHEKPVRTLPGSARAVSCSDAARGVPARYLGTAAAAIRASSATSVTRNSANLPKAAVCVHQRADWYVAQALTRGVPAGHAVLL